MIDPFTNRRLRLSSSVSAASAHQETLYVQTVWEDGEGKKLAIRVKEDGLGLTEFPEL